MTHELMKSEQEYHKNLEENVTQGIQHPMLVYWHNIDPVNEPDVAASVDIKNRYSICKSCDSFDTLFKRCEQCNCFMPIKTQFKMFSCPIGKW